jgi:hypothetical protein
VISGPRIPTPLQHPSRSFAIGATEPLRGHSSGPYFVRSAASEAKTRIMTSSESEEQTQTARKRSRRSNSGDDGSAGGKKARGRPRVDTQDATAADVSGDVLSFPFFLS